ncbi:MAG: GTP 3',8-cyclase MoaA [Rhodospirillaceae bacterium]|nr:GTP 3',8-cyclase MoaA [Rhodospirillaceae bacterium]
MIDPFGRKITYLRVSVTDRCDLRCAYCMPEQMKFLPKRDLLSLEEIYRLCAAFIELDIRKIRLTGGEPLVRRDVMSLIKCLGSHVKSGELDELTLTTNGTRLELFADDLVAAGIKRINVSLDTLDSEKYNKITRWGDIQKVFSGLNAAKNAGLDIKINTVALKSFNDQEFNKILEWSGKNGFDLTFIETMPMGEISDNRNEQYLPLSLVKAQLKRKWTLTESNHQTGGPARYVNCVETGTRIGFITPMTHNFCESCNRVRLTCTGTLYMCLGQDDSVSLREPLRASTSQEEIKTTIQEAISRKPKGHDFIINRRNNKPSVSRHMSVTGG